jgi:hypothetical protein
MFTKFEFAEDCCVAFCIQIKHQTVNFAIFEHIFEDSKQFSQFGNELTDSIQESFSSGGLMTIEYANDRNLPRLVSESIDIW